MEGLEIKYKNLAKAYGNFQAVLVIRETQKKDLALYNCLAAGVVKHFEWTYDAAWKLLRIHLYTHHQIDESSPKVIFNTCYSYNVLPAELITELNNLANARSLTMRIYDPIIARKVMRNIEKHHNVLGKILEIIKLPAEKNNS